jgi:uncharacterized membrane protein YphA (DoxX/SURF4 family)
MKVKNLKKHILTVITLLLLVLWIPVGLEKLWDLQGFKNTLFSQPIPNSFIDVLFWLIPVLEIACATMLILGWLPIKKACNWLIYGMALSSMLMLCFTVFIALGVLNLYEKRPCGCGSVLKGMSWEEHLWFNGVFLGLSLLGWWLALRKKGDEDMREDEFLQAKLAVKDIRHKGPQLWSSEFETEGQWFINFFNFHNSLVSNWLFKTRNPRRFALFPGRPVGEHIILNDQ